MFSMSDSSKKADHQMPLLEIDDLSVCFFSPTKTVHAVRDVGLTLRAGEILGLVGESGSGKTVTALSILRLVRSPGKITRGRIRFKGEDLLTKSRQELRQIRGNRISMIFQDPATSLNPVLPIGEQVAESLVYHGKMDKREALRKAEELFEIVRIPNASKRIKEYPHQLSGGMKQRVMIAMALACNPELLIADEPTTALDVTIQSQILDLLKDVRDRYKTAILLITHDMGVVAEMTERMAVMYGGEILSMGDTLSMLTKPCHPYILALLDAIPKLDEDKERLDAIPGTVPSLTRIPQGCIFGPRCRYVQPICLEKRPVLKKTDSVATRCWLEF